MIKKTARFISSILLLSSLILTLSAKAALPSYSPGEWEVLRYTNEERLMRGLRPLSMITLLQQASNTRANELTRSISHTRPDGTSCFTVLRENGLDYYTTAENIAAGFGSAGTVMTAWMNSPGHRSNILSPDFAHLGVGEAANSAGRLHWEQLFLSRGCSYQSLRLILPAGGLTCTPGTSVETLNVIAVISCSVHGDSYLPLNTLMCSPGVITQPGKNLINVEISGFKISFEAEGSAAPVNNGWFKGPAGWMHFRDSILLTGWLQDGTSWFFTNSMGIMQTGWIAANNRWYYMNSAGAMQTGWLKIGGSWYYLASSGSMETGWVKVDEGWYFLNGSGIMQTGWMQIGQSWYYLNLFGRMQTGWVKDGGTWYYMNSSGKMQTGWLQQDGQWYYLLGSGVMATGTHTIDGKASNFNSGGVWLGYK